MALSEAAREFAAKSSRLRFGFGRAISSQASLRNDLRNIPEAGSGPGSAAGATWFGWSRKNSAPVQLPAGSGPAARQLQGSLDVGQRTLARLGRVSQSQHQRLPPVGNQSDGAQLQQS